MNHERLEVEIKIIEPVGGGKTEKYENVRFEIILQPLKTDYSKKEAVKRILEIGYENRDIIEEFYLNRDSAKLVFEVSCEQDLNKMHINNAFLYNQIMTQGSQDKVKKEHPPIDNNFFPHALQFIRSISRHCRNYLFHRTQKLIVPDKKGGVITST